MTMTELLYRACVAALNGLDVGVFDRTSVAAFAREQMPCVRVLEGPDIRIEGFSEDEDLRELTLKVEIYVRGTDQVDGIDEIRGAVARLLWNDPSVRDLVHWAAVGDRSDPERHEADGFLCRVTQRFLFRYLVNDADLTRSAH